MRYLLLAILSVLLFACRVEEQANDFLRSAPNYEVRHSDLQSPTVLRGKYILEDYTLNPFRILAAGNYLLLANRNTAEDKLLTCFNLNTGSVNYFIKRGEGPLEMQSIYSLQYFQDSIFVFDRSLRKGFVYAISQFDRPHDKPVRTIRFDLLSPNEVFVLSNGSFIATSYSAQPLKRIRHFDREGNFLKAYIDYPNPQIEGVDSIGIPEAHTSNVTVNHEVRRLAIANQNQDLIEIYDEDFAPLGYINGPDFFLPAYESEISDGGMHLLWPIDEEIRDAYFSIQSDDRELFVLYSGDYPFREGASPKLPGHFDQLFVFDWEGRFLRNYRLDIPIARMAVDFEHKKIYGISDLEDTGIVRFDF